MKTIKKKTTKQESLSRNKKLFIKLYPEYGSIGPTLKAIGIKARKTFYNWCDNDPKFKGYYLTELLPNRRDELVSLLYKTALGRLGTNTETTMDYKRGRETTKEVPIVLPQTQLTAIFGMLKATDHIDTGADRLIFVEKHQLELSGKDGQPIKYDITVRDTRTKELTERLIKGGSVVSDLSLS